MPWFGGFGNDFPEGVALPVLLRNPRDLPDSTAYDFWLAAAGGGGGEGARLPDLARRLEEAFDAVAPQWFEIAKRAAAERGAEYAQMPACFPTCSDFGMMLAWARLVTDLGAGTERVLVISADPWLFRHLAGLPGIQAGRPPARWPRALALAVRGFLARSRAALSLALASIQFRAQRRRCRAGAPTLLVYGHPDSRADGDDSYFGPLMGRHPELRRLIHVDCPPGRARSLAADPRTASLHGWGNPLSALRLPFTRWRPSAQLCASDLGWLVARAAAMEGGTGQAALIRWQGICTRTWLAKAPPARIIWPWENHGWERGLTRLARSLGVPTLGYMHTPFGRHHWGFALASNRDGLDCTPDQLVCTGPEPLAWLGAQGYPGERIRVGGSLRAVVFKPLAYDPAGPLLVALSGVVKITRQMTQAVVRLAGEKKILIKDHPMAAVDQVMLPTYPHTEKPLDEQAGLSGVLFATSSIGLEALIGGLPVLRFRTEDEVAPVCALPPGMAVPATDAEGLGAALAALAKPGPVDGARFYAPPDFGLWDRLLEGPVEGPVEGLLEGPLEGQAFEAPTLN